MSLAFNARASESSHNLTDSARATAMTNFLLTSLQDGTLTLFLLNATDDEQSVDQGSKRSARHDSPTSSNSSASDMPLLGEEESAAAAAPTSASSSRDFALVLHNLHHLLLTAFHAHWRHLTRDEVDFAQRPTVMQFEQVSAAWRMELVRWLCRGRLAGWFDSRGLLELDRDALGQKVS